jgi:hypothetical protein
MKKRALRALAALCLLCSLPGCVAVSFSDSAVVKGEGEAKTAPIDFAGSLSSATVELSQAEVILATGPAPSITVFAQPNLLEWIDATVDNGALRISSSARLVSKEPIRVTLTLPSWEGFGAVECRGSGTLSTEGELAAGALRVVVTGSCEADVSARAQSLEMDVRGSANAKLSGAADSLSLKVSGSADFDALSLEAKTATVDISGSASASLSCSDALSVSISGSGKVSYKGNPKLTQSISGTGEIEPL